MGIGGQDCQLGTIPKFLQTVLSGSSQVESENYSCNQGRLLILLRMINSLSNVTTYLLQI